jgi:hypothetical protein
LDAFQQDCPAAGRAAACRSQRPLEVQILAKLMELGLYSWEHPQKQAADDLQQTSIEHVSNCWVDMFHCAVCMAIVVVRAEVVLQIKSS